eukprot:scaffold3799_cov109-Alexandrium_tamarense.AAC.1
MQHSTRPASAFYRRRRLLSSTAEGRSVSTRSQCPSTQRGSTTVLYLEDHIANMIDGELHRLNHKQESDQEWQMKQRQWSRIEPKLPSEFDFADGIDQLFTAAAGGDGYGERETVQGFTSGVDRSISSPQRRKDKRMAENDPMRYCADRCVSTGNCDVFEDMFEMSEYNFSVLRFSVVVCH